MRRFLWRRKRRWEAAGLGAAAAAAAPAAGLWEGRGVAGSLQLERSIGSVKDMVAWGLRGCLQGGEPAKQHKKKTSPATGTALQLSFVLNAMAASCAKVHTRIAVREVACP